MYQVDQNDEVHELSGIPQSSIGAPIPAVVAGESTVVVFFYAQRVEPDWNGTAVRVVGPDSAGERSVIVRFERCYAHMLGPPNDEAFSGHPLYDCGLRPYANFEVKNSSWLRALETMNSAHPYHRRDSFMKDRRHFILAFHDSTFECIASGYTVEVAQYSISRLIASVGPDIMG